jgi:lipopolysaccharide biosynthesis regulator YciM
VKKNSSVIDKVLTVGALIGGAFVLGAVLEALSKTKTFYRCPNCNYDKLEHGMEECPNCRITLEWNGTNKATETI